MKISEVRHIDDCLDGTLIRELCFNKTISREFILWLGALGKLQYFAEFSRPFFKIECAGKFSIKGVEGQNQARLIIMAKAELALEEIRIRTDSFIEG